MNPSRSSCGKQNKEAHLDIPTELRQSLLDRDAKQQFCRKLWRKNAENGFFKACLDNTVHMKRAVTELARFAETSLDIPFSVSMVAHLIGIDLITHFATPEQRLPLLKPAIDGHCIFAIANAEAHCGTDILSIRSKIYRDTAKQAFVKIEKNCATNLGDADVVFSSAWDIDGAKRPFMEMLMLSRNEIRQSSIAHQLSGFHTGLTGKMSAEFAINDNHLIGKPRGGFSLLGHCYNVERLFIGAVVLGILNYCRQLAPLLVANKTSMKKPLIEHQYVQDKIFTIFDAHAKVNGLMNTLLMTAFSDDTTGLVNAGKELALLKVAVIDEGSKALQNLFELCGADAYRQQSVIQKLLRDHQALTFLGGSKEQQKMTFIDMLKKEYKHYDVWTGD